MFARVCTAIAAACIALSACAPEAPPAAQAPAQEGQVRLGSTQALQDWLMIARTQDGGFVHFNQQSIFRENGQARIDVQVRYGAPQLYESETDRTETTIRYTLERIGFVFNCADETFAIRERQIVDENGTVLATIPGRPDLFRPTPAGGVARLVLPPACRGR